MKKTLLFLLFFGFLTPSFACTRYWVGGGASVNWNATGNTNWGSASNTRDNASVPTTTDDVCFDGIGFGASNSTISAAITIQSLDFTGYSNTLTHNTTTTVTIAGNLLMSPTMTYSAASSTSLFSITLNANIKSAALLLKSITLTGGGNTYNLLDNLSLNNTLTLASGALNTNGFNLSLGVFSSSNSGLRTLNACGSTITLPSSGTVWNTATVTNFTYTACSSNPWTVALTDTSASSKTFAGGGKTYPAVTITGSGSGAVIFTGANTFTSMTLGNPKTITWPSSTTTTLGSLGCTGTAGNLITFTSSTPGTQATLSQQTGRVSCDYLDLTDSATNWVAFYAGTHSNNTSNNSGWIFTAPPILNKITRLYNYGSN